ncbi:MAG: MCE family protein [Victivallales bacterium]|nr:MCE family protein [Victivallales bacterium]
MNKKSVNVQVTTVGFFVLSALVITILLLLALGGGKWNATTVEYKLYFDTSVKGLAPGSAVMFRGVNIGQVTSISLETDNPLVQNVAKDADKPFPIEVVVEIVPSRLGFKENWFVALLRLNEGSINSTRRLMHELVVENNLRAQLQTFSFLTGQLYVALNLESREVSEEERKQVERWIDYDIIPTQISMLERLSRRLGKQDFSEHIESVHRLLAQIGYFVESGKSAKLLGDISAIAGNLNTLTEQMKQDVPALIGEGRATLAKVEAQITRLSAASETAVAEMTRSAAEARRVLSGVVEVLEENRPGINRLMTGLGEATEAARKSLAQSEELLKSLNGIAAPESELRTKVDATLTECQEAALRLRIFLDLISRNPQVMLLGE